MMFRARKIIFLLLILTFTGRLLAQGTLQFKMGFDEISGSTTTLEEVSGLSFPITNHYNRPERISGISGNALRLDGFSTWVSLYPFGLNEFHDQLSIETWYATEAFNYEKSSVLSQQSATKGISLSIDRFGSVLLEFYADQQYFQLMTTQKISTYSWNHLVAVIDLTDQIARIYVNGEVWESQETGSHSSIQLATDQPLFVGRSTDFHAVGGFPVSCLNGALDELSMHNYALTEDQIISHYRQFQHVIPNLWIDPEWRHGQDWLRPRYHAMPNTGWTNEPYGLMFADDKYHLFFQKNPNAPQLFFMHWGHLSSPDLVHWKEEKIALSPSVGFDSFGVWSGTSILTDSTPVLFYTGVDGVKAGIGSAFPADDSLTSWNKQPDNPLIPAPPAGYAHRDFRDPYVWKSDSLYYMIVGSGLQQNGGGILFTYRSSDLKQWEVISPLYQGNGTQTGEFWEMPVFCQIDDSLYILAVTPVPTPAKRAETIYWLGTWQNELFVPRQAEPKKLELIQENLLSPAFGRDDQNRLTYIGIIPEDRNAADQIAAGWRHHFSLPRVVRLLGDGVTIGQIPHPNLCRLRKDTLSFSNRVIVPGQAGNLPEVQGRQLELEMELSATDTSYFEIQLLKNASSTIYTAIHFDFEHHKVALDRRKSGLSAAAKDYREAAYVFNQQKTVKVRVFIDRSVLEVFIDDLVVFSARVYPPENAQLGDLLVRKGRVEVLKGLVWEMKNLTESFDSLVCEPGWLPDSLNTLPPGGLGVVEESAEKPMIFPNPSDGFLYLQPGLIRPDQLRIYNSLGKALYEQEVASDAQSIAINAQHLLSGIYFLQSLKGGTSMSIQKILIQSK